MSRSPVLPTLLCSLVATDLTRPYMVVHFFLVFHFFSNFFFFTFAVQGQAVAPVSYPIRRFYKCTFSSYGLFFFPA